MNFKISQLLSLMGFQKLKRQRHTIPVVRIFKRRRTSFQREVQLIQIFKLQSWHQPRQTMMTNQLIITETEIRQPRSLTKRQTMTDGATKINSRVMMVGNMMTKWKCQTHPNQEISKAQLEMVSMVKLLEATPLHKLSIR